LVYSLFLHKDAIKDLEELWRVQPKAAAIIETVLEQIKVDQDLLDALTDHNHRNPLFDVSYFQELWNGRPRLNILRLKLAELQKFGFNYRILYAFDPRAHRYHVLAIVPRDFNYDRKHPITQRIVDVYRQLNLPEY